jgi:vacuolar-type H+-ATPase subunit H
MTSITRPATVAASQARTAVEKTAEFWTQGARTLTSFIPGIPQLSLAPTVERYFDFVQQTVEANRKVAVRWAQVADSFSGTVRDQADTAVQTVREKAEEAGDAAKERAAQAEHEIVLEARRLDREQAKRAHQQAREQYEGMTKAELSDLLAKRDLPKTGNVDELIERLVEADNS